MVAAKPAEAPVKLLATPAKPAHASKSKPTKTKKLADAKVPRPPATIPGANGAKPR